VGSTKIWDLVRGPAIDGEPRPHILLLDVEHGFGGRKRCAAPPFAHNAGVACFGGIVGLERATKQDRVLIQPVGLGLGFRNLKSTLDEALSRDVELAHLDGVGAVERQPHQRAGLVRRAGGASERPGDALAGAERVEVEQHIPVGLGRPVAFERGPAPQAARMRGILPEIVKVIAGFRDEGNPVVGVKDRQGGVEVGTIGLIAQRGIAARILGVDPGDRWFSLDFLEPKKRIVAAVGRIGS
jgi:hypothetical protein